MGRRQRVRQHTVARTHLLGFADSAQQLTMLRRDGRKITVSVGDATVEKDFYTFADDQGVRDVSVESWFADAVEGPAAEILETLRDGRRPTAEHRSTLALYLAAMLMRNKLVRSHMNQIDTHIGPMVMLTALLRRHHVDWETQTAVERRRWWQLANQAWLHHAAQRDPDAERRSTLRIMLRKIDEFAETLSTWRFSVCTSDTDTLITSDSAVAIIDPSAGPGWNGVLPKHASLAVPVTPSTLLFVTRSPTLAANGTASAALVNVVNRNVAVGAFDAIFKHPETAWPESAALGPEAPQMPTPTTTIGASGRSEQPTFPTVYTPVRRAAVRALLDRLGAVDEVD